MRLLLATNNQTARRNEVVKSYLQLGSSSNRYAPCLPQQEQNHVQNSFPSTDPILDPENILKTGFAQKGLPSFPSGRCGASLKRCTSATLIQQTSKNEPKHGPKKWDRLFFRPSPLPFGGSAVLSLSHGLAENRTTTSSLSATQVAEFVGFPQVLGFHLNDYIKHFTASC